jgi:hypothetical protein
LLAFISMKRPSFAMLDGVRWRHPVTAVSVVGVCAASSAPALSAAQA